MGKLNLFLFILIMLAMGCSAKQSKEQTTAPSQEVSFDSKFNKLEVGQSTDGVRGLLGDPGLREVVSGVEIWHYDGRKVEFKEKKVTGFAREVAAPVPAAELKSLKIGEDCQSDKQCVSGNCHFKVCSGLNNCSKLPGQLCATNVDCCNSICDFGVCKK